MLKHTLIAAVAAGILASASFAVADTVTATLYTSTTAGVNPGTIDTSVSFANGTTTFSSAYVGQINWYNATESGSTTGLSLGSTFSTYCIEGTQDVYFGGTYLWNVTELLPGTPGVGVPDPGTGLSSTQVSQLYAFWDANYACVTDPANAANADQYATAFQLGVWEIVSGDTLSADSNPFSSGAFMASGPVSGDDDLALSTATDWVAAAIADANTFKPKYTLYALTNGLNQDQIVAIPSIAGGSLPPGPAVPVPAALPAGLSLIGLIAAAGFVRRRRQMA